ncbi:RNA-guided endonuclease InsQ/TnpB family protein [Pyrinomonas methylaliphatogenes]|uniref:Transposase, IS605 OrfB family, central region n=1 Tax=Pyrinomonas methylaliphatogenes TaxID=454194 RepID=A0A0B6WVT4_9BACT|nr:RNA-guided endonuclease TnpB family protein [Pyrinomonas methylaliphatogenes]CDM65201.1 transposase, IS605 OrfB family, central region [Pyrinomonas methylaliphatogenes]
MKVNRAYRYELDPNVQQRILLAKHAGAARFAYNWGLARRIELYQQTGKSTNAIEQHRELNRLKKTQFPWLYEVSKCAPQEALRDLDRAFQNFFRGLKEGRKVGFPRFRKKGRDDRFRLTGAIRVVGRAVQLPRLGLIRLKEEPKVQGRILSATVGREADRWYVSLTVEVDLPEPEPVRGPAVGIDVGLAHFATLVQDDGVVEKILAPKPLLRRLRLLRRRQRRHSKKEKGSKNRKKSALRLARLHRRIRHIRQDFLHKLTTHLAKTKRVIVVEDLSVSGLVKNPKLARHIADVGWGEFRRMLAYKCVWYGSRMVEANRYFPSSKMCSCCGQVLEALALDVRQWDCPGCGTRHDRDVNAAKNLLALALYRQFGGK